MNKTDGMYSQNNNPRKMIIDVAELEKKYTRPYIGIIGATNPSRSYNPKDTIHLGFELRRIIEDKKGSLFTGGVGGIGTDVYRGIAYASKKLAESTGNSLNDKFFTIIPRTIEIPQIMGDLSNFESLFEDEKSFIKIEYMLPSEYKRIATKNGLHKPFSLIAGEDMGERRKMLAQIGDYFIMMNGSFGTLDEALTAASNGKNIIIGEYSGGMARSISSVLDGRVIKDTTVSIERILEYKNNFEIFKTQDKLVEKIKDITADLNK